MKKTLVVVTHDAVAADKARRVLHLDKGVLAREVNNRCRLQGRGAMKTPFILAAATCGRTGCARD
jgi:ABC-type transport system involved in cytochrome bd biosynthesis fused ATPase/permease subunit